MHVDIPIKNITSVFIMKPDKNLPKNIETKKLKKGNTNIKLYIFYLF